MKEKRDCLGLLIHAMFGITVVEDGCHTFRAVSMALLMVSN